jgi:hypothetical protein
MKPDKLSVYDIFQKERRYVVPLYQRAYVWNEEEQWEPLWEDIEHQADGYLREDFGRAKRSHFLGAVVLNVQKIVGSAVARSEIIDGQQRLTTLQIFICALRDYAAAQESEQTKKFGRLTTNDDAALGSESSFKVWPTNADRSLFRSIMSAGGPKELLQALDLDENDELPRMAAAYCYFYKQIRGFVGAVEGGSSESEKRFFSLFQALRIGLQLVVIELEENDDPQVIFETLNARGQPLLPSDLIRNTIFHQASSDSTHSSNESYADELYAKYWHQFDNDRVSVPINGEDRYWHIEERQGRLSRPRIDLFIFHFLVMQTGKELMIGQIFQEFRDWRDTSKDSLESFLEDLKRYAKLFRELISPASSERVSQFASRLRALDTSTVYPFLLYVLGLPNDLLSKADKTQIIMDVECWMIRRMICQLTNKNYNKFFVSLLSKVKQAVEEHSVSTQSLTKIADDIKAAVKRELERSNDVTTRWPNDDEFKKGWLEKMVYVKSRPDRAVMLLKAIDAQMATNKTERIILPEGLTVEHILPQKGTIADYPYSDFDIPKDDETRESRRAKLIHTIGNLTLLTGPLNSSVSNGPFSEKRPVIAGNSALRLNSSFQEVEKKTWSELDIIARGEALFEYARRIWPMPSKAEEAAVELVLNGVS